MGVNEGNRDKRPLTPRRRGATLFKERRKKGAERYEGYFFIFGFEVVIWI